MNWSSSTDFQWKQALLFACSLYNKGTYNSVYENIRKWYKEETPWKLKLKKKALEHGGKYIIEIKGKTIVRIQIENKLQYMC